LKLNVIFDKTDNVLNSIQMNIYNNSNPNVRFLQDEDEEENEDTNKEDNPNKDTTENVNPEKSETDDTNNENEEKPLNDNVLDLVKHPILLDFSMMDTLSFAAVISVIDSVAALTFMHEDSEPKLFSVLFWKGVVNDAVCIVIYKILTDFQRS
jgi:hypothetical protein